ncbi:hypothetical protein [Azonexus fungiphilus]|uniref:hypothetical protein n=1 Tax=Azonexus fungiphilus TaxID=146940 RepID=UPI00156B3997|nr:hypothetical protein [Azonexus fungiphilus]NHC05282.1 hypothetical protein [Azonexus fungiphilus]
MKKIACSLLAALFGASLAGTASASPDHRHERQHRHHEYRHHHPHYQPPPRVVHHHHRHGWVAPAAVITFGGIAIGSTLSYEPPPPRGNWYYCRSSGQYYPYTNACPEGWQAVQPH